MNNYIQTISGLDSIRLGWALVYFLGQGLVIAVLLEIALLIIGQKKASLRYLLCGVALVTMPVCLATTYLNMGRQTFVSTSMQMSAHAPLTVPASAQGSPVPFVPLSAVHAFTDLTSREFPSFELNPCMPWIVFGWLAGVMVLTIRKTGGFCILWHLRRCGVSEPNDGMTSLFREACDKIGIDPRRVCLKISILTQVPMTMGWLRPVVLFPAALFSGLSTGEIELLLAHELAHVRRFDYLVNLLQTVVETLFFYHPVTWWISRRIRQERENVCDDLVASGVTERLAYAKVLLRLESLRLPGESFACAANGGSLLQRIQRLLGQPAPTSGMGFPLLLVLVSILGVITAGSVVKAQDAASTQSKIIPVAQPVPAVPEAAFAQPITMKEGQKVGNTVTRLYYQGGNLILQQCLNASPGSVGQIVFYKHTAVVDDRVGTTPVSFSSRFVLPNNLNIEVQSIAVDTISPASLRILDSSNEIISEFFIDPTGVMRPITKAEHDANIALRTEKLAPLYDKMRAKLTAASASENGSSDDDDKFIVRPDNDSGRALLAKLKSLTIDAVNFDKVDVSAALQFFAEKSKALDPDKKGINFVLGDLSHATPQDQSHREVTIKLDNAQLDALLGYVTQQTNLKCSIENNTVYLKP
jgi:beta-lactamase regulating signal transducer with metallopeptidase domain